MARSLGSHFKNLLVKENATEKSIPSGPWQMPRKKFNIVVTNLEHDTNVSPFVRMAEDLEVNSIVHFIHSENYNFDIVMTCVILIIHVLQDIMEVRRVNINTHDCTLPLSEIEKMVSVSTI